MYSFSYNLFFTLKRLENYTSNSIINKFCKKYYDLFDLYLNVVFKKLIIIFPSYKSGVTKKKRERKIVVSLTSFPQRIETVWITIETIFRQTMKADEIILWLAKSQFNGFESLPKSIKSLCDRGLKIRFCDDLKSHKKYYYVFQEYKDDFVILMDDDMFYPKDTIEILMKLHKKHPEDTISITSQKIPEDITIPPSQWTSLLNHVKSSNHAQPFTGAGVLIQPRQYDKILYNKDLIKELAPYADDLWIYIIGYISGVNVTTIKKHRCFYPIIWGSDEKTLFDMNGKKSGNYNNIQWAKLVKYFFGSDRNEIKYNNSNI